MAYKIKRYEINKKIEKIRQKTIVGITGIAFVISGLLFASIAPLSANAASAQIYNNIPNPLPGNLTSVAFEATSTSEFGGQVQFAGTARQNPTVTVIMSSWGCESGSWFAGNCSTTPGTTFSEPITLNVYNVGAGNSVGSLVTTTTQTFNIPFRPSADNVNCTGNDQGKWFDSANSTCYNGFATPISFNLTANLPNTAIVTLAYNTSDFGNTPYGDATTCHSSSGGCGYDSLNVGLVNSNPTVGTNPAPNSDYINSTWTGAYCDNGANGTGTLRYDTGPSVVDGACPYTPAIEVTANTPSLVGFATGGLTLSNPNQQISFNAFDYGVNSTSDYGTVEYQNFNYPGGLHYTANISCVTVSGNTARFMFQIPNGYPGLSGLYVVASVTDNGSPGKNHDTYGHTATSDLATAQNWCENGAPVANYQITGGNAVVHKGS